MTTPATLRALKAAARMTCICEGECFETRHGLMNGPCERRVGPVAAAIAEFLRAPDIWAAIMDDYEAVTRAVERAAKENET